jgi:hypothetical protein
MFPKNQGLTKNFSNSAAIPAARFVKFDATDTSAALCAGASDSIIGVSDSVANVAANESVDVALSGIMPIEYGATVTRGQLLMSDSTGRAIPAAAAAGTNVRIGGVAMTSGVVNDVGSIYLQPGSFQG